MVVTAHIPEAETRQSSAFSSAMIFSSAARTVGLPRPYSKDSYVPSLATISAVFLNVKVAVCTMGVARASRVARALIPLS
eukprot:26266_6